jgi:hypothetical protein
MTPLALTTEQLRDLMAAAKRVPVFARDEFLQEVAEELAGREPGGGNLHRALAKAQHAWSRTTSEP